ncbi:MAG: aminotransferase class V-fold PLP-dependent enzyme [Planctomycetaceae bacterium]|nr:aminotransferase class V-fold PLP-dependent enzyme [Planctomycetaceae bacterium]
MSIYDRFGVAPVINASGSVTRLGGAPMPPAVLDAFRDAASEAVSMEQLQAAASRRIAAVTGAEAGLVTAGSAAALTLGTAAILTRYDPGKMERLPHCDAFPHEFVVAREQRSGYDHAVRAAGARLIEVGFNEIVANAGVRRTEAWEYEAAFTPNTAGVLYVFAPHSQPPLADVVERAHHQNLPVLVDAAGELPPRSNLKDILATGADLVAYSGGKAIRGPQSTGILCGRRELIGAAAVQMLDMDDHLELWDPPADFIDKSWLGGLPRHGIGRALKVSKEEIVALLTALDLFASGAYDADLPQFRSWLETIAAAVKGLPVRCAIVDKGDGQSPPWLEVTLDEQGLGRTAFDVCRSLRNGTPPVYVSHGKLAQGTLVIYPLCLNADRAAMLGKRMGEELQPR